MIKDNEKEKDTCEDLKDDEGEVLLDDNKCILKLV